VILTAFPTRKCLSTTISGEAGRLTDLEFAETPFDCIEVLLVEIRTPEPAVFLLDDAVGIAGPGTVFGVIGVILTPLLVGVGPGGPGTFLAGVLAEVNEGPGVFLAGAEVIDGPGALFAGPSVMN